MHEKIYDVENFNSFTHSLGHKNNSIEKRTRMRKFKTKQERVQKDLSLPNQKQKAKKGF